MFEYLLVNLPFKITLFAGVEIYHTLLRVWSTHKLRGLSLLCVPLWEAASTPSWRVNLIQRLPVNSFSVLSGHSSLRELQRVILADPTDLSSNLGNDAKQNSYKWCCGVMRNHAKPKSHFMLVQNKINSQDMQQSSSLHLYWLSSVFPMFLALQR